MNTWTPADLAALDAAQEVRIRTVRRDGSLRSPVVIWVVTTDGRVFVRGARGTTTSWYGNALRTGRLHIEGHETTVRPADDADIPAVDAAYRTKYGHYRSIVDDLVRPDKQAATLELIPA